MCHDVEQLDVRKICETLAKSPKWLKKVYQSLKRSKGITENSPRSIEVQKRFRVFIYLKKATVMLRFSTWEQRYVGDSFIWWFLQRKELVNNIWKSPIQTVTSNYVALQKYCTVIFNAVEFQSGSRTTRVHIKWQKCHQDLRVIDISTSEFMILNMAYQLIERLNFQMMNQVPVRKINFMILYETRYATCDISCVSFCLVQTAFNELTSLFCRRKRRFVCWLRRRYEISFTKMWYRLCRY